MSYSKARLNKFDEFQEICRSRLTSKQIKLQDAEIALEFAALQSMQECISAELAR